LRNGIPYLSRVRIVPRQVRQKKTSSLWVMRDNMKEVI
jgi:hypothetical protein